MIAAGNDIMSEMAYPIDEGLKQPCSKGAEKTDKEGKQQYKLSLGDIFFPPGYYVIE